MNKKNLYELLNMENYLNIGFIIIFLNEKLCHKTNAIIDRKLIFF